MARSWRWHSSDARRPPLLSDGEPATAGQVRGDILFGIVERHPRVAGDPSEWWTTWWISNRQCDKNQGWPGIGVRQGGEMAFHNPNMGKLDGQGRPRAFRVIQIRVDRTQAESFVEVFDKVDAELKRRFGG